MNELTLKIDCYYFFDTEIQYYLSTLNGIYEVKTNSSECEIYLKYNPNVISILIIIKEIFLFFDINNTPSLISFNKHYKSKLSDYSIIIKDLCCEYCLKSTIEELIFIDGINYVFSDFDYINKENFLVHIQYDPNIISEKELLNIKNKFN